MQVLIPSAQQPPTLLECVPTPAVSKCFLQKKTLALKATFQQQTRGFLLQLHKLALELGTVHELVVTLEQALESQVTLALVVAPELVATLESEAVPELAASRELVAAIASVPVTHGLAKALEQPLMTPLNTDSLVWKKEKPFYGIEAFHGCRPKRRCAYAA